jgi:hypothetical protein
MGAPLMNAARIHLPLLLVVSLSTTSLHADELSLRQIIDAELKAAWQRENVTPAPRSDDAAFLRRVYLDLVGTIPTGEETAQFLKDEDKDKRSKLIDRLLDDPRFAVHQADVWDLTLFGRHPPSGDITRQRQVFHHWLTEQFAQNVPYDRWVRDILLAEGNTVENGPPMFLLQFRGRPEDATEAVARLFLGTQLQCARCHDHPFDKWQQLDFYGMAGFFVRLTVVDVPAGKTRGYRIAEKSSGEVLFTGPAAEQKPGKKGTPVAPKFLGGAPLEEPPLPKDFKEPEVKGGQAPSKPLFSRKEKLAEWITAADNPYFARAVANRVWAQFLGRGLVHPVDDLKVANKASHPGLLERLTEQMKAHQFDLKWYIRELVNSDAYQLSSKGTSAEALPRWFERGRVRPLSAEEMLATLRQATGMAGDERLAANARMWMTMYFGEPTTGRGDFQPSLSEHLFLNNSGEVRSLIQRRKGNLADTLLSSKAPIEERVDQLFLAVLTRPPREAERERFVAYLTADDKKPDALMEEAIWVLLNCSEFRLNH